MTETPQRHSTMRTDSCTSSESNSLKEFTAAKMGAHTAVVGAALARLPPPELLQTNEPPSDLEVARMQRLRLHAEKQLVRISDQLSAAQTLQTAVELTKEREEQHRIIERFTAMLHPVRRLPPEILSEIFLRCTEDSDEEFQGSGSVSSSINPYELPWRLTEVSSRWRHTALSFPRLWSSVRIPLQYEDPPCLAFHLKLQLRRSGAHPLSVLLHAPNHISAHHSLLQILLPTSPRWTHLYVHAHIRFYDAISSVSGSLQSLEALTLICYATHGHGNLSQGDGTAIKSSAISTTFVSAPLLRSLAGSPNVLTFCMLPWSQITQFRSICFSSSGELLTLLRLMPNVKGDSEVLDPYRST